MDVLIIRADQNYSIHVRTFIVNLHLILSTIINYNYILIIADDNVVILLFCYQTIFFCFHHYYYYIIYNLHSNVISILTEGLSSIYSNMWISFSERVYAYFGLLNGKLFNVSWGDNNLVLLLIYSKITHTQNLSGLYYSILFT